jgi:protein ImuB
LAADPVRPRATQNGLFLPPSPEPEKLELTLARIAGIVGQNKVGSLRLLDTHRPEGFLMQHFAPNGAKNKQQRGAKPVLRGQKHDRSENHNGHTSGQSFLNSNLPAGENTVTALRIFRPPVHASVTLDEGRPTRIACPKRKEICGEILWAAGPWRISGDWWEQEGWAHDEWDIALQEATGITLYHLVRDLLSGQWRLEGSYD